MPVKMELDRHQSAFGLDGKMFLLRFAGGVEIAGEDAQAIAGLFCFAAVRIIDPQTEIRFFRRHQRQDAIAAQSPIAIADSFDPRGAQRKRQFLGVHDNVVVAQPMPAKKSVLHVRLL